MNTPYPLAKRLTFLQRRIFLPRFSPDGTKIVFAAMGRRRVDIYLMEADGSHLQCLTRGEEHCCDPVFNPQGTQIAYVASHPMYEELHDIHLMNADGTQQRALTVTHRESYPVFSPDGQYIAFTSGRDRVLEVYRMRADGSEQQRLTFVEDNPALRVGPGPTNRSPLYRSDGTEIVFISRSIGPSLHPQHAGKYVSQPSQIYRMHPDGTRQKLLVGMDSNCDEPMFSPNGKWLAFINYPALSHNLSAICLTRADGSGLMRLPDSSGAWASFHPRGDRIVFASCRDRTADQPRRNWDLYCIHTDTGELQRLTENEAFDGCPVFSPDGKQIVFCSDREGSQELYVMPYEG